MQELPICLQSQHIIKVLLVFGTRPEAIKMAPLIKEFEKNSKKFQLKICITAQHREMLDQVLKIFQIIPDYDLNIMKQGQDLYDITSQVILGMRQILQKEQPEIVLVHGDTQTSTISALAAFYQQIPVAHVEAGLRTNNLYSPWPEEANRQIIGRLARYHFAPTKLAKENLMKENINSDYIFITGNTVIDALQMILEKIKENQYLQKDLNNQIFLKGYKIQENSKIILVTGHRRENHGQGFINICNALKEISNQYPDFDIVYPVHMNPVVQKPVYEILNGIKNIYLIEPLEYLQFIYIMSNSYLIITNSGGIQEEAPSLGKPVLLMRNTTERPEAVDAGTVKLVGTDEKLILLEVQKLIEDKNYYNQMSQTSNPYGDGKACEKIIQNLLQLRSRNNV